MKESIKTSVALSKNIYDTLKHMKINTSQLINDLIRNYLDDTNLTTKDKMIAEIKEIEDNQRKNNARINIIQAEIDKIEAKERELWEESEDDGSSYM